MGQRGPLRNPNSRRGQAEIRKQQRLNAAQPKAEGGQVESISVPDNLPTCDKCLPRRVQEIYRNLVIELAGAGVPIKQIDSYAVTMAARCLEAVERAEALATAGDSPVEAKLAALRLQGQYGKDLIQWLQLICATPGARARIGMKPDKKPAAAGPLAQILAAKLGRKA
jgi:hypothetical protein